MNRSWQIVLVLFLFAAWACAQEEPAELPPVDEPPAAEAGEAEPAPKLETLRDKASYAIGIDIGTNLKQGSIDVDVEILARGIADALAGPDRLLTDEEIQEAMTVFQEELRTKRAEQAEKLAAENKEEGTAFLAANAKKKGVKTTKSGLQYKVLKEGDGPTPKATDTVTTHYRGTLIDGTEFDSSYSRDEPTSFPVDGVIAGWTEALQMMKVGSKWQLFVPADLAYGDEGRGPEIEPGSMLIFEIELLKIEKP
jgi:FKBP-type peptidyl-prolyl cis-trans isomerase FklB